MKKQWIYLLVALMAAVSSCKKDKDDAPAPQNPNEEELFTTVKLVFKKSPSATDSLVFSWRDTDGDGGNAPTIQTINITDDYTYMALIALDESNPANVEDMTEEIKEEADEHQLFYTLSSSFMNLTYADSDDNGVPIGLKMTMGNVGTVTNGSLQVVLKHQPGVKPTTGFGNAALGSTDFDVTFPINITSASIVAAP
ncbi:MAG: hypothetical protein MUE33_04140 [Cytophagaceae bacterium]|jgi:hypothetical protein|nr:hypothetical protein [Cytophagaceae bacterium]